MSPKAVRIFNFDNSVVSQGGLIQEYHPAIVDVLQLGPWCRHWAKDTFREKIQSFLDPAFKNSVTFLGSGDFHHVSSLLTGQFSEPLSVIVFDNHPDWDILPPRLGCGSWVSRVLEQKNVKKVVIIGVSTDDISTFSIQTGNLNALRDNRLELYPYRHKPTKVFLRSVPRSVSIETRKHLFFTEIIWKELAGDLRVERLKSIFNELPTDNVYVSIDKDCLNAEYALTNWEEGQLKLEELISMLKQIQQKHKVIAADITGEYSDPEYRGGIKKLLSHFDHPHNYSARGASKESVQEINQNTNLALCRQLCL